MNDIEIAIAQLRHAYAILVGGQVSDLRQFAEGLIAPQIERLERLTQVPAAPPRTRQGGEDTP